MDGVTPGGYGGFEVGDDRYELPKVIAAMRTGLSDLERHLAVVGERLALGTSFGARVITPHNQGVAVDLDGLLPRLASFRESLDEAAAALTAAESTYEVTEQDNTGELGCR